MSKWSRRWRHATLAVAVVPVLTATPLAGAQDRPVFRTEIGVVVLRATVRNARGELMTDLGRDAFTVEENGRRQQITLFTREDVPVSLGIALDNSGSMRDKRSGIEAAALALVAASNPRDELFVLNFGDKPRVDVPFTSDASVLKAGIARLDAIGGTALRDSVEAGVSYLRQHGAHERKALLVVTDGNDNASAMPAERLRAELERRAVTIHAIGLLDTADPGKARRGRHELEELVEATGGLAYFPQSVETAEELARDLARQIRSQYTIGYSPANQALDGSYRKIRVVAKGAERLIVRTRPGYRATPDRAATAPSSVAWQRP
jgi:Ca-activated chloride channel homolog